jgi:phosphate transport system permease protein
MLVWTILLIAVLGCVSFFSGRQKALNMRLAEGPVLHSMPVYHGLNAAALAVLSGIVASIVAAYIWTSASMQMPVAAIVLGGAGAFYGYARISKQFRARNMFETIVDGILVACSAVAVLATIAIVFSVLFEAIRFFAEIPFFQFIFGLHWAPTSTPPSFGFIPLVVGTLLITTIAIAVAAPLGLMSAIYLAEYASMHTRNILKPLLEMLAGVPTVVLGFFAALTVAPMVRNVGQWLGLDVASESALAAGLVMGMMIVPLISSLSDDIINSVPQALRDGSLAMGATPSETIKRVVLPAALPGIVSAMMLAISRAIGETMIVVMAAGLAANLSFNPFAAVTTITVQIASLLVGDQEFDSAKTLSAFALGLVLFVITLSLNFLALKVVQKYREQYD